MRQRGPVQLLLTTVLLLSLAACSGDGEHNSQTPPTAQPAPEIDIIISDLWEVTIAPLLEANLWESRYNYDATHYLMVPMHWAFNMAIENRYREAFEAYFSRYLAEGSLNDETNRLRKLQYLYLHSQFLKLSVVPHEPLTDTQMALAQELEAALNEFWVEKAASNYGVSHFPGGVKDRMEFKLSTPNPDPEHARAIFDEEHYLFTIAADIIAIKGEQDVSAQVIEIRDMGYRTFVSEGVEVGDGWLFQPGVWSHHPDYRYVGNESLLPGLSPIIIDDIAIDSSHMHRMPLWLTSLRDSYDTARPEYAYFDDVLARMRTQLDTVMLAPADAVLGAPRLFNFSDGWNGVYRYNYDTVADNLGYGPFQLSGVLPYSWYAFLGNTELANQVADINFPLTSQAVDLYVGPNTSRIRHPLVTWPEYFTNGFAELNFKLFAEIASQ